MFGKEIALRDFTVQVAAAAKSAETDGGKASRRLVTDIDGVRVDGGVKDDKDALALEFAEFIPDKRRGGDGADGGGEKIPQVQAAGKTHDGGDKDEKARVGRRSRR